RRRPITSRHHAAHILPTTQSRCSLRQREFHRHAGRRHLRGHVHRPHCERLRHTHRHPPHRRHENRNRIVGLRIVAHSACNRRDPQRYCVLHLNHHRASRTPRGRSRRHNHRRCH